MKQIKIGTCVPGAKAEEWLKGFIGKGFETFSLNFHMSLEGTDLDKLALSTENCWQVRIPKSRQLDTIAILSSTQSIGKHWKM